MVKAKCVGIGLAEAMQALETRWARSDKLPEAIRKRSIELQGARGKHVCEQKRLNKPTVSCHDKEPWKVLVLTPYESN